MALADTSYTVFGPTTDLTSMQSLQCFFCLAHGLIVYRVKNHEDILCFIEHHAKEVFHSVEVTHAIILNINVLYCSLTWMMVRIAG